MGRFLIRRLLWLIPVMLVVAVITFVLMHAAPGGPFDKDPNQRQIDPTTKKQLKCPIRFGQRSVARFSRLDARRHCWFF